MINVDDYKITLIGDDNMLATELALLLHAVRKERPKILLEAMYAEDELYEMTKEGK